MERREVLNVAVRWKNERFTLTVHLGQRLHVLRKEIQRVTGVLPSRQKLLYKGRILQDDTNMQTLGLKEGASLYLVGSNDVCTAPGELPHFVEEMTEEEKRAQLSEFMAVRDALPLEERQVAEFFISSIPGMPDFVPYDFTFVYGKIKEGQRYLTDLANGNLEAAHLRDLARELESATNDDRTEQALDVALSHYSPRSSPLALAMSGLIPNLDNPFLVAVQRNNTRLVKFFLSEGEVRVNQATDYAGKTALHWAVQHDLEPMVDLLVSYGARVDQKDNHGCTAVYFACERGKRNVVSFLLNKVKGRVESLFSDREKERWFNTAIKRDHVQVVQLLIDQKISKPYAIDTANGFTALHQAACWGAVHVAEWLVDELCVPVDLVSLSGATPLSLALRQGGVEMVELLLSRGAKRGSLAQQPISEEMKAELVGVEAQVPSLKRLIIAKILRCGEKERRRAMRGLPQMLIDMLE